LVCGDLSPQLFEIKADKSAFTKAATSRSTPKFIVVY
jgi:hypothetical protein